MAEQQIMLKGLVKQAPPWAAGISIIILAIMTALTTTLVTAKTQIDKWMENAKANQEAQTELTKLRSQNEETTIAAVLKLVSENQKQVTEVSRSLGQTEEKRQALGARVNDLEKQLIAVARDLTDCELDLKRRNGGK